MGYLSQRDAFGRALQAYGGINQKVVVLDADTSSSTLSKFFADAFPERFFNVGIAEPCLVDVAVGMALAGLIPVINAFSALLSLRALEQIRTCIAYAGVNVKIAAGYAGLSDYKDGPTHHSIMDIGIMRMLPGMSVIVPGDELEIKAWVPVIIQHKGPVYFRLSRDGSPIVHESEPAVGIGKGFKLKSGNDVGMITAGMMTSRCLRAAQALMEEGITSTVIEMPSIKPLDTALILETARETGALVTVEEHSILGGLGSAIAELVTLHHPVPIERVGIQDVFARTGPDPDSLMDAFGLSVDDITKACKEVVRRKQG